VCRPVAVPPSKHSFILLVLPIWKRKPLESFFPPPPLTAYRFRVTGIQGPDSRASFSKYLSFLVGLGTLLLPLSFLPAPSCQGANAFTPFLLISDLLSLSLMFAPISTSPIDIFLSLHALRSQTRSASGAFCPRFRPPFRSPLHLSSTNHIFFPFERLIPHFSSAFFYHGMIPWPSPPFLESLFGI